ncbi:MAG: helix-turn-helix domain-containing protein [Sandaracinaceae bacterium]|nr:helix-turn-helix domain-containing protein [Sandaracinaceae bacterium]
MKKNSLAQTTKLPALLTLSECAEIARAPLSSVRYWVSQGRLRSVRPGRLRLVRRADLALFLGIEVCELV